MPALMFVVPNHEKRNGWRRPFEYVLLPYRHSQPGSTGNG